MTHLDNHSTSILFKFKWPNGFICPRCKHNQFYLIRTRNLPLYQCRSCKRQTSLIVDTIMEGSRTAIHKWLIAIRLVSRLDKGVTAVELSSVISVTYKTAWLMLHKIRHAISCADQNQPLAGSVKAGLSFYCRPYPSMASPALKRSPVIVAAQVDEQNTPLTIKMKHVSNHHMSFSALTRSGEKSFRNTQVHHSANMHPIAVPFAFIRTPLIKSCFEKARKWLNITFNGIGPKYLQAYLNEYCCRYNLTIHNHPIEETLTRYCATTNRVTLIELKNNRFLSEGDNMKKNNWTLYKHSEPPKQKSTPA